MISSLATKCQYFKLEGLQFHYLHKVAEKRAFQLLGQKFVKFFHCFFGKFKTSNGHSEINWPLEVVAYLAARMTTNRTIPQITNWPPIRITSFFCCKMSFSVSHKEVVSSSKRGILSLYQNWIYCFKSSYYQNFTSISKLCIPSTINIWKKVLTKAIWADKKWASFWQISLYIK